MKKQFGTVIAARTYIVGTTSTQARAVHVEIAAPAKSPHAEHAFSCAFRVKSSGHNRIETVYGIDALHALLLALGYLEAILHRLRVPGGVSLHWAGGEDEHFGIRIPDFSGGNVEKGNGRKRGTRSVKRYENRRQKNVQGEGH